MRNGFLLALVAIGVGACGPTLNYARRDVQAFESSQRCTQGPFDLHLQGYGARWGERVALRASSGHRIGGHVRVEVDGVSAGEQTFDLAPSVYSNTSTPAPPLGPGNSFCLAPAASDAPGATAAPAEAPVVANITLTGAAPEPAAVADVATLQPTAPRTDEAYQYAYPLEILSTAHERTDPDEPRPPLRAGADIHIRLWSDEPNDLQGVQFYLAHEVATPSVPEAEYITFLRRRIADAAREARESRARSQREYEASERASQERDRRCAAHHEDTGCWGPGGYDGAVARAAHDRFCDAHPGSTGCPALAVAVASEPEPPAPPPVRTEPDGPPPAPRAEVHPPQPSVHAEWVPGYWHWSAGAFGWIAGRWNVPDQDRAQGLTVHAPSAPPPLRAEALPAAPAPEAVWTAGYWQWSGAGFVWIDGSWQLPPSSAARWRPAAWSPRGVQVVFDPGGWF